MLQGFTARATAPRRIARHGFHLLTGCAATALLFGATPAAAQQYFGSSSSVTVDYGVLDNLGPDPNLPALLGGRMPTPGTDLYGYPATGQLLPPPATAPRSTLTMHGPVETDPTTATTIKLIPPSEFKNKKSKAPAAAAPSAQAAQLPPAQQPAVQPPPPPQPTSAAPVAPPPPPTPTPVQPTPAAQPAPVPAPAEQTRSEAAPPPAPPEPPAASDGVEQSQTASEGAQSIGAAVAQDAPNEAGTAAEEAPTVAESAVSDSAATDTPSDRAPAPETIEEAGEKPGETQLAALPVPAEGQISVTFAEGSSELSPEAMAALDKLIEDLRANAGKRIQLLAYAKALDDNTSRARRTSLSRALEVRSYLIERGIQSTRMDVRALGSNVEGEPADRVDIIPQAL